MGERPARLSLIWLVATTLLVVAFGAVTSGLWYAGLVLMASPGTQGMLPAQAFALYSMAGPVAAALGVLVSWSRVIMGKRASGLKWMIVIPIVWLIGLLGWLAIVNAFCGGQFDCRA